MDKALTETATDETGKTCGVCGELTASTTEAICRGCAEEPADISDDTGERAEPDYLSWARSH